MPQADQVIVQLFSDCRTINCRIGNEYLAVSSLHTEAEQSSNPICQSSIWALCRSVIFEGFYPCGRSRWFSSMFVRGNRKNHWSLVTG